jgi:2,3-bisphosphoglycerate-independent phosphoglycerate mutase
MEAAKKPAMDRLAAQGIIGRARTLFDGMPTGSDVANLSVLGYDPREYYTGRSPVEALGMGVKLEEEDTVFRLNFVTLSEDASDYSERTILDHSAGKITNEEAYELLESVMELFGGDKIIFYPGVSYRHIMVWKGIDYSYSMTPPHDILGKKIGGYFPDGGTYEQTALDMMKQSYELLSKHPVNLRRRERGLAPANSIWLWGEGKKPAFESFEDKYGISGAVVTAVPLIMGLAAGMGMEYMPVNGATGEFETNYRGKRKRRLSF